MKMSDWQNRLVETVQERWHSKTGLVLALFVALVLLVGAFASVDLSGVTTPEWIWILAACSAIVVAWTRTRLPRVRRKKVGFGIAIEFENDEDARRVRSDFVLALRALVQGSSALRDQFAFVEFSQSVARQLTDQNRITRLTQVTNLRFLLCGRVRLRAMTQGQVHVFNLSCTINHGPIATEKSAIISREMGEFLPAFVVDDGNLFSYEFAAIHVDAVARYLIGAMPQPDSISVSELNHLVA